MLSFDGPVGVRTDNSRFKFELLAGGRTGQGEPATRHAAEEDEEG